MNEFWFLILVSFFATNSLDKAKSVQLEELPLQSFDELFVDEWWDKDEAEDLKTPAPTNFGQIEPSSTDQLGQKPNSTDQLGQIEPSSTNAKNGEVQNEKIKEITSNENVAEDEQKRKIIDKFHVIKDEFKQKEKYSKKEWTQIEEKIAKHLKVNRSKIYKWKKELCLNLFYGKEERKDLVEKFDQMKAELKRAGFKNSYKNELDETVAKELGLNFRTIYAWKRNLGQTAPNHKYTHSEQKELMKRYYEIKDKTPKISDKDIAKMLNIGSRTLVNWKKSNLSNPNSLDGHGGSNVQEIGHSNSSSI